MTLTTPITARSFGKRNSRYRLVMSILVFVLLVASRSHAYDLITVGTTGGTSNLSGPANSTTAGDRNERHATIYSATELTNSGLAAGSTLFSIAWEKTGAASYTGNNITFRIWLRHATATTWAVNPTFATETASPAVLVYQTTTFGMPADPGWLTFVFNQATFTWNGTDHLEVVT